MNDEFTQDRRMNEAFEKWQHLPLTDAVMTQRGRNQQRELLWEAFQAGVTWAIQQVAPSQGETK